MRARKIKLLSTIVTLAATVSVGLMIGIVPTAHAASPMDQILADISGLDGKVGELPGKMDQIQMGIISAISDEISELSDDIFEEATNIRESISDLSDKLDALLGKTNSLIGPGSCPDGMTLIGSPGSFPAYCMDSVPSGEAFFGTALGTCKKFGKSLCSMEEYAGACMSEAFDEPWDYQWVNAPILLWIDSAAGGLAHREATLYGGGGCEAISTDSVMELHPFRCCSR